MILGHLGLALGARAVDREAPLAWLVAASVAPDVLDIGLAAGGVCNAAGVYTHSLLAIAATSAVLGVAAAWQTRSGRTALVVAALVVSHLLADYLTGLKALWIGGPIVGLELYRWPWADFAIEAPIIAGGWWAARRWGNLPRWLNARLAVVLLLAGQLAADAVQKPDAIRRPAACAKSDLIKRAGRLL
ncbi:MAG TPA: metal-dependent hydrolase [Gemmatimonadaceae bacterium]|nr:metal-dependent hydrolase [Gemmatimonadaceae bacterium]